MQISATEFTLAAILEPKEARELRDILIDHPLTMKYASPGLTELYEALDKFVDGEEEDDGA